MISFLLPFPPFPGGIGSVALSFTLPLSSPFFFVTKDGGFTPLILP